MDPSPVRIITTCLDLTPAPALDISFTLLKSIWDTVQEMQIQKHQLQNLTASVAQLLLALNDAYQSGRAFESTLEEMLGLNSLLDKILVFVKSQASSSFLKSYLRREERTEAIRNFHSQIDALLYAFNVSAMVDLKTQAAQNTLAAIQDQDSLKEKLHSILSNENQLADVLDSQNYSPQAAMVTLQKTLQKPTSTSVQDRQFLIHSLDYLASTSPETSRVDSWTITSLEVEFGKEIGSESFGQVYQGTWNNTPIALKTFRAKSGAIPQLETLHKDFETWANLRHPHILQFLGASILDEIPFMVMPYLKNGNAREFISAHPTCDRVKILQHVSLGLVYLHSRNVVHGDIKASNIFIDDGENAVLSIGLSHVQKGEADRNSTPDGDWITGSWHWMSPERLGTGLIRKSVDIYAFGMSIFEISTSEMPLGHIADADLFNLVVNKNVRPERPDDAPELSDELWNLAERCWEKDPDDRPNAVAVSNEMSRCLALPRTRVNEYGNHAEQKADEKQTRRSRSSSNASQLNELEATINEQFGLDPNPQYEHNLQPYNLDDSTETKEVQNVDHISKSTTQKHSDSKHTKMKLSKRIALRPALAHESHHYTDRKAFEKNEPRCCNCNCVVQ